MTRIQTGVGVVTGAVGGMGWPCAQRLAAMGFPLLLCDLNPERLSEQAEALRAQGATVEVMAGDVAEADYAERLVAALGGRGIGALIHTAGLSPTMGSAERILEVNYGATERLVRAIEPLMASGACAVMISSCSAYMVVDARIDAAIEAMVGGAGLDAVRPFATQPASAYPISKRAVIRLVGQVAGAFGRRGARIASIAPGLIDTPMSRAEMEQSEQMKQMLAMTPLQRLGVGDEIASVAAFLCSPEASYVSGCDIKVDGGLLGAMKR